DVDDAIGAVQHGDTRPLVEHLARHGIEVEAHSKAMHVAQVERQKVEKKRALIFGGYREQIAPGRLGSARKDILQIGRLAAVACAIVDNLALNLAAGNVNEGH